jgi:hypothetical protein
VAEEPALHQRRGHGRAVHFDERLAGPAAGGVQGTGHQLLAGARLAGDEHGRRRGRDLLDGAAQLDHGRALADDVAKVVQRLDLFLEVRRLAHQRLDAPLGDQPVVDAAEDDGEVLAPADLEPRQARFRRERGAVGARRFEAARDPQVLPPLRPCAELTR